MENDTEGWEIIVKLTLISTLVVMTLYSIISFMRGVS